MAEVPDELIQYLVEQVAITGTYGELRFRIFSLPAFLFALPRPLWNKYISGWAIMNWRIELMGVRFIA
jgi:hypothetical protein